MRDPELLDAVRLTVDLPETELRIGDVGTIVEVFCASDRGVRGRIHK